MFTEETHLILRESMRRARDPGNVGGARDYQDLSNAIIEQHPLLTAMDALLKAARTYKEKYGRPIAHDSFGGAWLEAAYAVRRLLNCDFGPVHSGTVEAIFWKAIEVAGYTEANLVSRGIA